MASEAYDLIVIGAGPGGYIGAIRAAQLGLKVACIEKEPLLGGTCLRIGCVPSKALLESSARFAAAKEGLAAHGVVVGDVTLDLDTMQKRKTDVVRSLAQGISGLFKKHKITPYQGHGRITAPGKVTVDTKDGPRELAAKNILIVTGSKEARLPGVEVDGDRIGSSTEALAYTAVPKHLVVIGAGAIGLELGSVWSRLGAKVTVLEYLDRILPGMDAELAGQAQKLLAKQGLNFVLGSRVSKARKEGKGCIVEVEGMDPIKCDRVLMAVGRVPNTDDLGLDSVGITLDKRGRIPVDTHFATQAKGIYAVGDVIAGPMLAHKAEEEAVACVEHLVTGVGHMDYDTVAYIVYTEPEVASVGKTEEQLKDANIPYKKGSFPFLANSRARAMGEAQGFVKMLAHAETDRILGVHIVGHVAGELIAEAATAMAFGASSEDIARVCHAHPTLSEAMREAALAVDKRTLNI